MSVTIHDLLLVDLVTKEAADLGFTLDYRTQDRMIHLRQTHKAYCADNILARFATLEECRAYLAGWGDSRQYLRHEVPG